MGKIVKNVMKMTLLITCALSLKGMTTYAATQYTDTESNNSASEAQNISSNAMSYAQKVSGSNSLYRYVTGQLTGKDDEDWYKVFLYPDKENYFTINGGTGTTYIDILDSNENILQSFTYSGQVNSEHVYSVDIDTLDTYYIRLYHNVNVNSNYNFTIGNPQYLLSSYTYKFGSQVLPARGKWEKYVNLATDNSIPEGAIGYKITVGGGSTSISSQRYFYNDFFKQWVATRGAYYYNLPVTQSSMVAQSWGVKYVSSNSSSKSFDPIFTIDYVYPELPISEK